MKSTTASPQARKSSEPAWIAGPGSFKSPTWAWRSCNCFSTCWATLLENPWSMVSAMYCSNFWIFRSCLCRTFSTWSIVAPSVTCKDDSWECIGVTAALISCRTILANASKETPLPLTDSASRGGHVGTSSSSSLYNNGACGECIQYLVLPFPSLPGRL